MVAIEMAPAHWVTATIGDLIDEEKLLVQNGFPCGEHNQTGRGVIQLRPFNVSEAGTLNIGQTKYVPEPPADSPFWVENGDIIFNNTNSEELVGKTAYFDEDGAFVLSNHMTILRVLQQREIDARWLAKHLHFLWQSGEFRKLCRRHVNQASVGVARLRSVELRLPPLKEQVTIARALDAIGKAKTARQRELALEGERKTALMGYLFTHGTGDEATKQTEIGEIPQSWQVKPLSSYAELITKGSSPNWQGFEYSKEGIIFVRSQNVVWGRLELSEVAHLSLAFNSKEKKSILHIGDLLVNIVGASIGRAALATECVAGGNVNQAVAIIRLRQDECDPVFIMNFIFTTTGQERLQRQKKDIARANLSLQDLADFLVPIPSVAEQREIASVMNATDRKSRSLEKELGILDEAARAATEELMTGRLSAVALIEEHQAQ